MVWKLVRLGENFAKSLHLGRSLIVVAKDLLSSLAWDHI